MVQDGNLILNIDLPLWFIVLWAVLIIGQIAVIYSLYVQNRTFKH